MSINQTELVSITSTLVAGLIVYVPPTRRPRSSKSAGSDSRSRRHLRMTFPSRRRSFRPQIEIAALPDLASVVQSEGKKLVTLLGIA